MKKLLTLLMMVSSPVWAQGSMAPEVRVIEARPSPSIIRLGNQGSSSAEREFVRRESVRQEHRLELERLRSANQRALEADRAYYKRLEAQRKRKSR